MLSVAIVNWESPELTARCARSIHAAPPSEPFEVVVVDNGSRVETLAPLRALEGVRLVETGVNGGFGAGVNRCLAAANAAADVVVVLNSDTEVTPGALDALAQAARRPGVGLAAPLLQWADGRVQISAHRSLPTLRSTWSGLCFPLAAVRERLDGRLLRAGTLSVAEHEAGAQPAHVTGAAMAIGRAAWERVGPFDERYFMYLEETDWQRRMHARGLRVALVPRARVMHLHRGGAQAIVPPPTFLDSARIYFGALGHGDGAIRAALASALLVTWLTLTALEPFARWTPQPRSVLAAARAAAWRGVVHAARGRWVPRP